MTLCGSLGVKCGCGLRGETLPTTGLLAGTYPILQTSGSGEATEPYDVMLDSAWPAAFNTRVAAWVNSTTLTATPWNTYAVGTWTMNQGGSIAFSSAYSKYTRFGSSASENIVYWDFVANVTTAAASAGLFAMSVPQKSANGTHVFGQIQIYDAVTGVRTMCSAIGAGVVGLSVNAYSDAGPYTAIIPAGSAIRGSLRWEVS